MSGIKTTLLDLGKSFQVLKAMEQAAHRKEQVLKELQRSYSIKGFPEYRAQLMAQDQYNLIHKPKNLNQ